jgi:hypothetical protein
MADGLVLKVGADISQAVSATKSLDKAFDKVAASAGQLDASVQKATSSVSVIMPAATKAAESLNKVSTSLAQVGGSATQLTPQVANAAKAISGMSPEITKAEKAARGAVPSFTQLQKQVSLFGGGVNTFVTSFKTIPSALLAIPPAATRATGALRTISPGANSATLSMINLGRVVQDAPFGFLGIANNLNPLLESFQRLKQSTGTTGGALKALGSSILGAGGLGFALSVVSSLLIVFGDRLFGTKANAEASEAALAKYKQQVDAVSDAIEGLSSNLAFLNKLGSLNIKIAGLGDLVDLREQSIAQQQVVIDLQKQRDALLDIYRQITLDQSLSNDDRKKALDDNLSATKAANKAVTDAENTQRIIYRQIQIQKNEDAKKAQDEALKNYEKYVNDTISKAKALQSEFPALFPNISFSALDTQVQQFNKASKALEEFYTARSGGFRRTGTTVAPEIQVKAINIPPDPVFRATEQEVIDKLSTLVKPVVTVTVKPVVDGAKVKAIEDIMGGIKNTIVNGLSQSFNTFIDAISRGANAFQSFGQLVGDVIRSIIAQLVKAVALAAILAALGIGPAGGSFIKQLGGVFGGFRAGGGPVTAGKSYVVGENGPEVFRPSASGSIISNDALSASSGRAPVASSGGTITTRVSGRDLLLLLSREGRSQGVSV